MKVSIIIPTYNRSHILEDTLESLEQMETDLNPQVIVVDDSDTSRTEELCGEYVFVEYVRPEKSINLPHARNVGLDHAEHEIVAFVDDDVRFHDKWLESILETFQDESVVSVGGPAIELEDGEARMDIIRKRKPQNQITEKGFVKDESSRWIPPEPVEVDNLRGANMAFRKSKLSEIGGFDENYIGNSFREDTDIFARLNSKGAKIVYNPDARVDHLLEEEGGCRDRSKDFWYSLGHNQRRFVEKNFSQHLEKHLTRMFLTWSYAPYSLSKILLSSLKNLEMERLHYIRGFLSV
ncbi:MAG: glycosyltransferase family 2 protein [Candidatus Nanohaloarchaea archaeon]